MGSKSWLWLMVLGSLFSASRSQSISTDGIVKPRLTPRFVSLALIPYKVQRRRLRRLQLPTTAHDDDTQNPRRRRRRRLDSLSGSQQVIDALYQGYGTHYVDLWCGTPTAQRQTVIVDTGSSVTAFPCLGCNKCGDDGHHVDSLFNQSFSSTFEQLNCSQCQRGHCQANGAGGDEECRFGMSYQEGSSWSAFEALDICYAGGPHDHPLVVSGANTTTNNYNDSNDTSAASDEVDPRLARSFAIPMKFGCQTHLTGLFRTQLADGIMGMDNAGTAFWSQMHQAGKIDHKVFSLCFSREDTVDRQGTQAGAMTLGGTDPRLHTSPMVYASNINGKNGDNFFAVHIRRIYLRQGGGGDSATPTTNVNVIPLKVSEDDLNRVNTIVDSGTTDTYFSSVIAQSFALVWHNLTGKTFHHNGLSLTTEQLNQFPTILFQLGGDEESNGPLANNTETTDGLAGSLDVDHPLDVILAIPPSHYMEYDDELGKYFNRFYPDDGAHSVLGANAMMGHDVHFDVGNARIGWAESHCDYTKLLGKGEGAAIPKKQVPGDDGSDIGGNHEEDTPSMDVKHPTNSSTTTTSSKDEFPWTASSCTSMKCRGVVGLGVVSVLLLGFWVARTISSRRQQFYPLDPQREYQLTSELELSNVVSQDDDDYVHYQDGVRRNKSQNGVDRDTLSERIIC